MKAKVNIEETVKMVKSLTPSTWITDGDRMNRGAGICGPMSKREKLKYFFDLVAEDVDPVDYQDIDFKDFDITQILNRGSNACYWLEDKSLTASIKAQRNEGLEADIEAALVAGDAAKVAELQATRDYNKKIKAYVPDFPIAFDIETTSVTKFETQKDGRDKCVMAEAYTYHWQTLIDTTIVHCHSWEEQMQLFTILTSYLETGEDVDGTIRLAKIWDANLGFEFGFMNQHLEKTGHHITRTFSKTSHNPITAQTVTGLLFVDALTLTNTSLEKMSKQYSLPTKKTHDLDYSVKRNTMTPLTDKELYYCSADVRILGDFHRWLYTNYTLHSLKTPLTATGIVRTDVKSLFSEFTGENLKSTSRTKEQRRMYRFSRNILPDLLIEDYDEYYEMMTMGFSGGFTQASSLYAGQLMTDVNGGDFTSRYPACNVFDMFPMSKFVDITDRVYSMSDIMAMVNKGKAVMAKMTFKNMTLKDGMPMGMFSASKTYEYKTHKGINGFIDNENAIIDNGKIIFAEHATFYFTEQDLLTLIDFYDFEIDNVYLVKYAEKGYLPDYVRAAIFMYYQKKAELKRQGLDETTAYKLAKACVNSIYGLMCQKAEIDEIIFSPEKNDWFDVIPSDVDINAKYKDTVFGKGYERGGRRAPKTILSPYWAIYTTALARRKLAELIKVIGDDVLYCDTDSIYFKNPEKYDKMIEDYNKKIRRENLSKIEDWNDAHGFDRGQYDLMSPDEQAKYIRRTYGLLYENVWDLGEFDKLNKLGNYTRFKTLGAKRYLKEGPAKMKDGTIDPKHVTQTIAGLPKTAMLDYCEKNGSDPFEFFSDGMIIPKCKKGHRYNMQPHTAVIEDEHGNIETMTELSSVGIFDIDFSMGLSDEYVKLINMQVQELRRKDHRAFLEMMKPKGDDADES